VSGKVPRRRALLIDRWLVRIEGLAVIIAAVIVGVTALGGRPIPGIGLLLLPAIPLAVVGQLWTTRWTPKVPPGIAEDPFELDLTFERGECVLAFSRPHHVAATGNATTSRSRSSSASWRIEASASPTKVTFNSCDALA
jgi:hypothetical protein